jgi:hypothetical protein
MRNATDDAVALATADDERELGAFRNSWSQRPSQAKSIGVRPSDQKDGTR